MSFDGMDENPLTLTPRPDAALVPGEIHPWDSPGAPRFPIQPFFHLDALWIQVAGSRCNLRCTHCFVSCGPEADRHALLSRAEVASFVAEGARLGVREFYFTGGEPFLHPELPGILEDTLRTGPCTVLTNGTLVSEERAGSLVRLGAASRYSLEIRVSFDGASREEHDRVRGPGAFDRALGGARRLIAAGALPILTVTQLDDQDPLGFHDRVLAMFVAAGIERPRLKLLPLFRLGREPGRSRGYRAEESLRALPAAEFDPHRLQCGSCRAVTSRGVFVCPLLVDEPRARLGDRLRESLSAFELSHGACSTCYATGMSCGNS